jgi:hypothetical protein
MAATATDESHRSLAQARTGERIGSVTGLAFVLLFFVGIAMLDIPQSASDQDVVAWWSDGGNQLAAVLSMYCFVVAGLCFLVFLTQLRSRLLAAEDGYGDLTTLVVATGAVFVSMLFVAAASRGAIGFAVKSPANDETLPGPDTLRYLPQIGYAVTGTGGLLAVAVTMATTSWLIVRTAVFGRWLAWVGGGASVLVVLANAALAGVYAIPAIHVWAAATSVAMWRAPRSPPETGQTSA